MPAPVDWFIRLLVPALLLLLTVEVRRLRREVHRRDDRDAEVAKQTQRLMSRRRPNPAEGKEARRRRFWVPSVALLAAVGGWARHYSGPVAGVVSTAAAVTLLVVAGSGGSTHHDGRAPVPVAPATSELPPSPTPTTSTTSPTALPTITTTTAPAPATAGAPASFAMYDETPASTPRVTTTVTVPTITATPTVTTAPTPARCLLLRVRLTPATDLCVST